MVPLLPQVRPAAGVDLDEARTLPAGKLEPEREATDPGADLERTERADHVTQSRWSATDRR